MFINLYIARPTYYFILMYTYSVAAVWQLLLNEYVMLLQRPYYYIIKK